MLTNLLTKIGLITDTNPNRPHYVVSDCDTECHNGHWYNSEDHSHCPYCPDGNCKPALDRKAVVGR